MPSLFFRQLSRPGRAGKRLWRAGGLPIMRWTARWLSLPWRVCIVIPQSILARSITISLVLHAGLLGLSVFASPKHSMLTNTPLRVRILEPPAPQLPPKVASPAPSRALPQPAPPVAARRRAAPERVDVLRSTPPPAKGSASPAAPARPSLREQLWNIQASFRYKHPCLFRRD